MTHPRFEIEPISLPSGWSGRVLAKCHDVAQLDAACTKLPDPNEWWEQLVRLAADPASLPGYKLLKYSKEVEVLRAHLDVGDASIDVIGKQSRLRGLRRQLAAVLRPPRERRNLARALKMLAIGVNTALPLALIERHRFPREAWLLTTYIPDLVDLDNVTLQLLPRLERQRRCSVKNAIASAVVGLLVCLHRNGLTHRDLKASNIMLTNWDGHAGPVKVWLVDLDGLRRLPRFGAARRWKPLVRLAASLQGYSSITHSDYARFLKFFMKRLGIPQTEWKRHYRDLARRADAYVRRAASRKLGKLDGFTGEG